MADIPTGMTIRALAGRYRLPGGMLVAATAYGIAGYVLLLGWSLREAVYMTVVTLSTVGFREVRPLGATGEVFTITLILFGLITVFAFLGATTEVITSGRLQATLRRRRVRHDIGGLRDHFIVCGYGRVGRAAVLEFTQQGIPVVVIDHRPEVAQELDDAGLPHLCDDASREGTLRAAGISDARGLVCALDSDALNVYVTLTGRALKPDLLVVARASDPESTDRLQRAGADRVIQPYALSGKLMASVAIRPAVVDFLDLVAVAPDLRLEELMVRAGSVVDGLRVDDVPDRFPGVTILARRPAGSWEMQPQPPAGTVLAPGDLLVALGPVAALGDMAA
jgi:voltage-gated potassium channel